MFYDVSAIINNDEIPPRWPNAFVIGAIGICCGAMIYQTTKSAYAKNVSLEEAPILIIHAMIISFMLGALGYLLKSERSKLTAENSTLYNYPEIFTASTALATSLQRNPSVYCSEGLLFNILTHASRIQSYGIGVSPFPTDISNNILSYLQLPAYITPAIWNRLKQAGCFEPQSQSYDSNSALVGLHFLAALAGHDVSARNSKVRLLCDRVAAIIYTDNPQRTVRCHLSNAARRYLAEDICSWPYVGTSSPLPAHPTSITVDPVVNSRTALPERTYNRTPSWRERVADQREYEAMERLTR